MYDRICRDCVIGAITWLKEHNSHYTDIKLNEHWYSDIASRELSVQLDKCDNRVTLNEDSVLNQSLKMKISAKRNKTNMTINNYAQHKQHLQMYTLLTMKVMKILN